MNKYFATFISGFEDFIKERLNGVVSQTKILTISNGIVIFETDKGVEHVKNMRYFSNVFSLISEFNDRPYDDMEMFNFILEKKLDIKDSIFIPKKNKSFRVIYSEYGNIKSVNNSMLLKLEEYINKETGLELNRSASDSEFWIFKRNDGVNLFGHRITYHHDFKKALKSGSLRPDLCNIMCLLSEPNKDDVFLDPFSGSGAINEERKRISGYKNIIIGDIASKTNKLDATNMFSISTSSVTKIVTDPPWGLFDKNTDINTLYRKTFMEFKRVLRKDGIIVILVANLDLIKKIISGENEVFRIDSCYNILVNGKKASVIKIIKINE